MATAWADLPFLLCLPFLPTLLARHMPCLLGRLLALPLLHLCVRLGQWLRGDMPWPKHRDALNEVSAASTWAQGNQKFLRSDGRLVLCGYSSGGHCASLHVLSEESPRYESVVLVSGLYNLRTESWTGFRRFLAPVFNMIYKDAFGVADEAERSMASGEARLSGKKLEGDWYVLSAKMELLGMQPFQDILFDSVPLCEALTKAGAKVHRVTCGHNHWLLIMAIDSFIIPFCKSLGGDASPNSSKRPQPDE